MKLGKKTLIFLGVVTYLVSSALSYAFFANSKTVSVSADKFSVDYEAPSANGGKGAIPANAPRTEECPINGEMLTKQHRAIWQKRRPLLVMVENHVDSRPQSGLSSADVVYEAVAEGGITRFMAVFYCKDSDGLIGPIRSARIYFVNLATSYGQNPLYAHVGGANCNRATGSGCANGAPADALGKIRKLGWNGYNDLDHVAFPVMFRDYERLSAVTEHTVYSSTEKLFEYAAKTRKLTNVDEDGVSWDKDWQGWEFKDDKPSKKPVSSITFDFWEKYNDFRVNWKYDPKTNAYKRFTGGVPHKDLNNDRQLTAKNIAVVFMEESIARDGYDSGQHLLYDTTGQGDMYLFRDGEAIEGIWRRKNEETLIRFFDKSGKELELNRGKIFVEILPEGNEVDF